MTSKAIALVRYQLSCVTDRSTTGRVYCTDECNVDVDVKSAAIDVDVCALQFLQQVFRCGCG